MPMCYRLEFFSSLFDKGFELVIVAGAVQELFLAKKFNLSDLRERLDKVASAVWADDEKRIDNDFNRDRLISDYDTATNRLDQNLLVCRTLLLCGLIPPVLFQILLSLERSGYTLSLTCDPGIVIVLPVLIVLGWGPLTALYFGFRAYQICQPLEGDYQEQIDALIGAAKQMP